jgi:hypothetical protein
MICCHKKVPPDWLYEESHTVTHLINTATQKYSKVATMQVSTCQLQEDAVPQMTSRHDDLADQTTVQLYVMLKVHYTNNDSNKIIANIKQVINKTAK